MQQYIVTVKHTPISIFGKPIQKFRVNANGQEQAKEQAKKHPLFPNDGEIIRVRYAAYKKR